MKVTLPGSRLQFVDRCRATCFKYNRKQRCSRSGQNREERGTRTGTRVPTAVGGGGVSARRRQPQESKEGTMARGNTHDTMDPAAPHHSTRHQGAKWGSVETGSGQAAMVQVGLRGRTEEGGGEAGNTPPRGPCPYRTPRGICCNACKCTAGRLNEEQSPVSLRMHPSAAHAASRRPDMD